MIKLQMCFIVFLLTFYSFSQTISCGVSVDETFNVAGALPNNWTEYNTSGHVTVDDGRLKIDYTTNKPAVYHSFNAVTDNFIYSFDIESTRNYTDSKMNLISSTGEFLASFTFGLLSNLEIQYASTMNAGVPSGYAGNLIPGIFTKDTNYSISANVNFQTQTIDFYNDGMLMASNIPFLETTQDVAKIDFQLDLMFSNEGRFFFDNISLINGDENRLLLMNDISASENIIESASVGDRYNQYPQSAIDDFQLAIGNANEVLANCTASSSVLEATYLDFKIAKDVFDVALVNNPILKIYPEYNFSGEEHEMFAGYYNGTLDTYDDWASSFTLEKGYMVTFAENVNGTGASKVYVAAENDLRINLPADLKKTASFIRVGPWFDVYKKGMAGKGRDVIEEYKNSWHYNWSINGTDVDDTKFVPNQWSGGSVAGAISLGKRLDIAHYMAFNEPDGSEQANMTVDRAIEKYEDMLASGLRLGSPATKDNNGGQTWRDEFMTKAEANGLRVDYMVVHYYKRTTAQSFFNWLKAIHDKWQRPIWIKEFNYGATWTTQPASNEAAGIGLKSYMDMLDDASFVERYSVFTWQPDKPVYSLMSVRNPVTLSSSGIMYRDHESPIAYTQEIYEQGAPLSIGDKSIFSQVVIYPTLVKDGSFNLKYSDEIKNSKVELIIYNVSGQLVKKIVGLSAKIDVNNFSSGLYIVKIKSELGVFTEKIIVE